MQRSHHNNNNNDAGPFSSLFTPLRRSSLHNNRRQLPPPQQHNNNNNNNYYSQESLLNVDNMADRGRGDHARNRNRVAPYPPTLQHRASQTVIDLTGDSDEAPSPPQIRRARSSPRPLSPPPRPRSRVGMLSLPRSQPQRQRPPRLGRDDILDDEYNEDDDDDLDNLVDLTGESNNFEPNSQQNHGAHRNQFGQYIPGHPPNRVPPAPRAQFDFRRPAGLPPPRPIFEEGFFLPHGPNPQQPRLPGFGFADFSNRIQQAVMAHLPGHRGNHALMGFLAEGDGNLNMNYEAVAFAMGAEPQQPAPPKAPYVPPPPAREGFTRSPALLEKDEIMICAACDEELVVHEEKTPPPKTNAKGKALTEKERAEHHFWALKDCGHVSPTYLYCSITTIKHANNFLCNRYSVTNVTKSAKTKLATTSPSSTSLDAPRQKNR